MIYNRKRYFCRKCSHRWIIENKKIKFSGNRKELKLFKKENGRNFGECYCGTPIGGKKW